MLRQRTQCCVAMDLMGTAWCQVDAALAEQVEDTLLCCDRSH